LRVWGAGILVAAYALAVLLPSLAFSFDGDDRKGVTRPG